MKPPDYAPVELNSLPYLDNEALGGRQVPVHSFFDGEDWHMWVPTPDGKKVQPLQSGGVIEGMYLANEAVLPTDLHSDFVKFFEKRTAFPGGRSFVVAITNDLFNIAASLTKLQMLVDSGLEPIRASRLALTEVEYLVVVCRAVFDLMQETIHRFWKSIRSADGSVLSPIPQTFSKVELHNGTRRTTGEISARFGVSDALTEWYEAHSGFFDCLRQSRDTIVHSPKAEG